MFPGQDRTPRKDIPLSLGGHICVDTELSKTLLPCPAVGFFLLEDLEICTHVHTQPTHTYIHGYIHMSADVFRDSHMYTCMYIQIHVYKHTNMHTQDVPI